MARDWFKRNQNAGNVLKTNRFDVNVSSTIKPDANITVVAVDLVAAITLTGDVADAIIGDIVILAIRNNTGGALTLTFTGGFADVSLSVNGGGVASVMLVMNDQNFASIVAV